jgi:hypothetical protein
MLFGAGCKCFLNDGFRFDFTLILGSQSLATIHHAPTTDKYHAKKNHGLAVAGRFWRNKPLFSNHFCEPATIR